jgi:hypothetical protein
LFSASDESDSFAIPDTTKALVKKGSFRNVAPPKQTNAFDSNLKEV